MADQVVYVEPRSVGTVRRWLETVGRGSRVTLTAADDDLVGLSELARQYDHVAPEPVRLPLATEDAAGPLADRVDTSNLRRVVLPLALEDRWMRHAQGVRTPRLDKCFDAFRRLWRCGFREFELFSLAGRRVLEIPHMLDGLVGKHRGQRAFIVGNGPSLNQLDMSRLREEITFGSNRCYLGFEQWGYAFTYWGCTDRVQIEDYAAEYEQHLPRDIVKLFPFEYLPFLDMAEACPINQSYKVLDEPGFADTPAEIYMGNTVTYTLIQAAAMMGCDPIVLVGTDHSYNLKDISPQEQAKDRTPSQMRRDQLLGKVKRVTGVNALQRLAARSGGRAGDGEAQMWQASNATSATHFTSQYTQGKHFAMPRPRLAENAFRSAASYAQGSGIRIVNATPGTQLRALPRVPFDSLF